MINRRNLLTAAGLPLLASLFPEQKAQAASIDSNIYISVYNMDELSFMVRNRPREEIQRITFNGDNGYSYKFPNSREITFFKNSRIKMFDDIIVAKELWQYNDYQYYLDNKEYIDNHHNDDGDGIPHLFVINEEHINLNIKISIVAPFITMHDYQLAFTHTMHISRNDEYNFYCYTFRTL